MFFFSGIFMVTAGVFLIVYNSGIVLGILKGVMWFLRASPAPVKMAISYPMKKRFRTGVTIFMFALIIFTITGLSMVVHLFNVNIDEFERSIGGGYDIIGISAITEIPDLQGTVEELWGEDNATLIDWDHTSSLSIGLTDINVTTGQGGTFQEPYMIAGVPVSFGRENTYGFTSVDWDELASRGILERTDDAVWSSLTFPDLVIVDGTLGTNEFGPPGLGLEVGNTVRITTPQGNETTKTIVAITDQFAIQAVFMSEGTAASQFNVTQKTVHMISVADGADSGEVSDGLRRSLLRYGLFTIVILSLIHI
jgi:putative ABC transport system permease protein